jgi:hypothetical protein
VTGVFNKLLNNAQQLGYLKGLGQVGSFKGILKLHFVDDTLLFLEAKDEFIETLKWILIAFEDLLGLKINFDKCEIIPLNILDDQGVHLANYLGCKLTHLPLTYLGVLLHFKKLAAEQWNFLMPKIGKKNFKVGRINYSL